MYLSEDYEGQLAELEAEDRDGTDTPSLEPREA